ncbi:GvpL/GvpF family gas vesicle protein [Dactylosporangium sp. CA-092794]|uniref:GvpL/GvpF family gas vesicle protein n=1 Tax=Dactylosporangium sp. CA-092794 TaxID=3239929 RepID=UPI003D93AD26
MTDDDGVWLHAVARDLDPGALAGLSGVGGGPLRAVEAAGLAAVVSSVGLDEFGAEPMRRNLENLAWLEAVARAHHGVVDAVGRHGPVVPARLGTVYLDDARVRAALAERHDDFVTVLERVAGRTEWGVKAFTADRPEPAEPAPAPAAGERSGPGAAYLRRRRDELSAGERRQRAAAESAEEVHGALAGCAAAARRHPPQDRSLSGEPGQMVLNGAYLVDAGRAERFRDTVSALAARFSAVRLQLTGPWPPYSFATLDEDRQGAPR